MEYRRAGLVLREVVAIEPARGRGPARRTGRTSGVERPALHEINVEVAVAVIVEQRNARSHDLGKVQLTARPVVVHERQPRLCVQFAKWIGPPRTRHDRAELEPHPGSHRQDEAGESATDVCRVPRAIVTIHESMITSRRSQSVHLSQHVARSTLHVARSTSHVHFSLARSRSIDAASSSCP